MKISRIKAYAIFVIMIAAGFSPGRSQAADFQYWSGFSVDGAIVGKLRMTAAEELRFSESRNEIYYAQTDLGLNYAFKDWLVVGAAYRQVFEKFSDSNDEDFFEWRQEKRPLATLRLSTGIGRFRVIDRQQFEYRFIQEAPQDARYRHRLDIGYQLLSGRCEILPYIADEIFIDITAGQFSRNRFYIGVRGKPLDHLSFDVYYLEQSTASGGGWSRYNAIGSRFSVSF